MSTRTDGIVPVRHVPVTDTVGDERVGVTPRLDIIVLATSAAFGQFVDRALAGQQRARVTADPAQCLRAAADGGASCAVVEITSHPSWDAAPVIRALRARASALRIVGCVTAPNLGASHLLAALRAGVDRIIVGADGTALRDAVTAPSAPDLCRPGPLHDVACRLPRSVAALLARCLPLATAQCTVASLARAAGCHRKTLGVRLARAGGPAAERFRAWCVLLRVAHVLDVTGWSIERIALVLEFSSGSAVSHLTRRYTGRTPGQLRAGGAVETIGRCFVADCAAAATRRAGGRTDPDVCGDVVSVK